jgi:hypothetical protein
MNDGRKCIMRVYVENEENVGRDPRIVRDAGLAERLH